MDTKTVYSTKAEKYAKYRWDYAASAIETIFDITQLSTNSSIAELGAGTGILTQHFAGKVKRVYAIEPSREMRQILADRFESVPSISVMDTCAEDTKLPTKSVDVITVAQAIHWFDPGSARNEMLRILKNNGWLVILRNYSTDEELNKAIGKLMAEEYGMDFSASSPKLKEKPIHFYYGDNNSQRTIHPFQFQQNWEEFIGAMLSASYMPDENNPLYQKLEEEARNIFSLYSRGGYLSVIGETELFIGQPSS